jgi:hypothetical protein
MPSAAAAGAPATAGNQPAQLMGITFGGTNAQNRLRSSQAAGGAAVTAKFNGSVVGTAALDAVGHAVITFAASVPRSATLTIAAGATTVTVVLAKFVPATAVAVTVTAGGVTVLASGDPSGTGNAVPSMADNDAEDMDEDQNGNVIDIDNPLATTLPANLPVTIVAACGAIVITPLAAGLASIRVREQTDDDNDDGDSGAKLDVRSPFSAAITVPIVSTAARLRVEVFGRPDEQGPTILEVRAPIGAVTGSSAPSPCPSVVPTALPSASPSPSPSPAPTPTATPSPSPSPTVTPTARPT